MSQASTQLLGPIMAVIIGLGVAVLAVGSTAAEAERNDGATVDTTVEIIPPTDETGIIIVSAYVENPAGAGGTTTHTFEFGLDLPTSRSGASVSPPQLICIPEAGTLCPRLTHPSSTSNGTLRFEPPVFEEDQLAIDPPGLEGNTNDLRGKLLRITPSDDGG